MNNSDEIPKKNQNKHPNRTRWYISVFISLILAAIASAGAFAAVLFGPGVFLGDQQILLVWVFIGLPLGAVAAVAVLTFTMSRLPGYIYFQLEADQKRKKT